MDMSGLINIGFENGLEPTEFYLSENYPNPFKEKTVIKYCIAHSTRVKLTILNSEGKEIQKLVDEEKNPGTYQTIFYSTPAMTSGIYVCRLEADDYKSEKKLKLIK